MKVIKYTQEKTSNQDMCEQPSPFDWSPCYQHPVYFKFKSHNGRKEYRFKAFLESVKYPEDDSYRTFRRINRDLIEQHAAEEINENDDDDDYLPPTPDPSTYSSTNFNDDDDDNDENDDDKENDDDNENDDNDNDDEESDVYANDENDDNDDDENDDENDDVNCTDETIELEEFETRYVPIVSNDEECYNFTKDLCDELNYENAYISSIKPA